MRTRISRWDDSLTIRIPRSFADELHLDDGSEVHFTLVDGKIIIVPVPTPTFTLNELLEGITEQNIHHEFATGNPVGQEAW
jgi:antitoxin MazE